MSDGTAASSSLSKADFLRSIAAAHGQRLERFFASRVSEPSEVHDLVQEVYLRLLKLERPDLIRSPKAYLSRIAANIAGEYWLKRASRPPHVELEDEAAEEVSAQENHCATYERLEQLALMLGDLPPKVSAALIWAHRDGHTYQEISQRLSVPTHRVKKYLARALAHCRRYAAST